MIDEPTITSVSDWNRELLKAAVLRHARSAFRKPWKAPAQIVDIVALFASTRSAQNRLHAALKRLTPQRIALDITNDAPQLARLTNRAQSLAASEFIDAGDDEAALGLIAAQIEAQVEAGGERYRPLAILARRAQIAVRLLDERWPESARSFDGLGVGGVEKPPRRSLLALHSRGPLVNNGYSARSLEVLNALKARDWSVEAVTRLGYPHDINRFIEVDSPEMEVFGGVECRMLKDPGDGVRGRPIDDYVSAYARRLIDEAARFQPSVLHAASNYLNGLAVAKAGRSSGIASVYEVRGLWEMTALSRGDYGLDGQGAMSGMCDARFRLSQRLETAAARAADGVLTLSEHLRDVLIDRGAPAGKISVVPNCVDVSRYKLRVEEPEKVAHAAGLSVAPNDFIVGYFGALVDYEGLDTLIEAVARLRAEGKPVRALIVGGGPAEAGLRKAALALGEGVIMTGRVAREDVEPYACCAHVVALPRKNLPVTRIVPPIKAAEAMARGLPVIVSDLPALSEIIEHEVSGLQFRSGDAEALARAIDRLRTDDSLRLRIGRTARKEASRRFDSHVVGGLIEAAYETAIARRQSS